MKTKLPTASEILDRLKLFYGYTTNAALARRLKLSDGSAINNWYRRNTLDIFLIAKHCPDINLDWMFWGRGTAHQEQTSVSKLRSNLTKLEKQGLPRDQIVTLVAEALESYLQKDDEKEQPE